MKRTAIEAFNETMLIFEKQCREQERFGEEFERNNQSEGADKDMERYLFKKNPKNNSVYRTIMLCKCGLTWVRVAVC